MTALRVGITNQKGGVAKTTNTINIAGALASRGHRVLAGDLDPQGYLTTRLGLREAYTAPEPTLLDALKHPNQVALGDVVVEHPEFDVLPSNVDMFRAVKELIASGWKPNTRLQTFFDSAGVDDYDFVLIDAPPSLGPINDNVLLACQNILVPVETELDVMQLALEHLLNQIETLEERYDVTIEELGFLVSDIEYPLDNDQHEAIAWFEDFGAKIPVFEIAHRVGLSRSVKAGGSIFGDQAEETDQADVYLEVAEVLEDVR